MTTPSDYPCPLPSCGHVMIPEPPGAAEADDVLADVFGLGVFAAHARSQRLHRTEQALKDHLDTHPVSEWAAALATVNKRIAELEASHG